MQPEKIRPVRRPLIRPLLAALLAAGSGSVWADDDPNPYYIGTTLSYSHDSNVFRNRDVRPGTTDVTPVSDNYWSAGLVGGLDQPIGRQRLYANGNVRNNRYQTRDDLNNTSFGLKAGLDWATIERLTGNVNIQLNQNLATYDTFVLNGQQVEQVRKRNIQQNGEFSTRVQWGLVSLYSLEGSYTHRQLRYSAKAYDYYSTDNDAVSVGIKYRPSGSLTLGAALRATHGDFPERKFNVDGVDVTGQTYNRNDLDLTAYWFATGQSTINARLSVGRQKYKGGSENDFSGLTGSLTWTYKPTGKLRFDTTVSRDTGSESAFTSTSTAGGATSTGDSSRLTTALIFGTSYAATAKINLNANFSYYHRSLENSVIVPPESGSDSVRRISLGASYAPTRSWLLNCNLGRDQRSTSLNTLSYPYSANTASCSAQFTIQ